MQCKLECGQQSTNVNETPSQRQQQHQTSQIQTHTHSSLSLSLWQGNELFHCRDWICFWPFRTSPPLNHLITPSHTMEEHHPKSSARHLSLVTVGAQIYLKTWSDEKLACWWVQGLFCWAYLRQREGSSKISNFLPNLKAPYMKILQNSQKIFTSQSVVLSLRTLPADSPKWTHLEEDGWLLQS